MAKDGNQDRVKREISETNARIGDAYEKLAAKFRKRMRKADGKAKAAGKEGKQEALRRRSRLFGKAAKELEGKVRKLKAA
jgi:hypothetical protein